MEVSGQFQVPSSLLPGRRLRYQLGCWVGLRVGLDAEAKRKIPCTLSGIKLRSSTPWTKSLKAIGVYKLTKNSFRKRVHSTAIHLSCLVSGRSTLEISRPTLQRIQLLNVISHKICSPLVHYKHTGGGGRERERQRFQSRNWWSKQEREKNYAGNVNFTIRTLLNWKRL
jgi:hypothetical protein